MNMQERLAQRCNELEKRIAALETLEATMAHIFGWDGSAWRKLALIWGYSARYSERISNLNADVGDNTLTGTAVSAGEVLVVQRISAYNQTSAITQISINLAGTGDDMRMQNKLSPAVQEQVYAVGPLLLAEGNTVEAWFEGCTAGDDIYLDVWGYKMTVNA